MLRRLLPTLLALGFGLLALAWGLVSLQRIFAQERQDAHSQLRSRRDALEQYASESLQLKLARSLEQRIPTLYAAVADPLAPAEGFYLRFRGYQFLPRLSRPSPVSSTPARDAWVALSRHLAEGSSSPPWLEPLALLRSTEAALASGNSSLADSRLEALLRLVSHQLLPPAQQLPFLVLLVERLQRGPATPPLVRALLRQGLPEDVGGQARSASLQRDLLRERSKLSQPDFDFLLAHLVRLSTSLGEPVDDVLARSREFGAGRLVLPDSLDGPSLLGALWYLEPRSEELVLGLAVDLEALLADITREMRSRELFGPEGRVRLKSSGALQPASLLRVEVATPQWARAEADIQARYGLKSLLVAVCGALAVAIVALAVVAQQRKYRFLELKSDFVATVSHELRTPLASIRLLAETLERKLSHSPDVRDYPARIVHAADGLHFLVENILSFNRIDKGRWLLRPSLVRLEELIHPLREELASATSVPVHLTSTVQDVELHADPSLLRLLLSNLGRNACAYNRRIPVELSVRATRVPGHGCTVLFSDNGVGLPEAEWERVFGDFYRLSLPGPEVHGSGLGLALCRRIMRLHGGEIQVAASSSEGTTFLLVFPEPRG